MSMKKKFAQEIYKLLGATDEGNIHSLARMVAPDVVDLARLLRSSGFRVSKVNLNPIARASLSSAGSKSICSVQLTCARSGLNVLLESEGVCRCPEAATSGDDSVSTWIVESPVSPSCSQENLSKSEQAGSSLLPELPATAAEKDAWIMKLIEECIAGKAGNVGSRATTREKPQRHSLPDFMENFSKSEQAGSSLLPELPATAAEKDAWIMKLIEECVAGKAGNVGSRATTREKPQRHSLPAESNLKDVAQPGRSVSDLSQTRSLDDMESEAITRNIAPSFQEMSISAISSTSKSEEQLMLVTQQPPPNTLSEVSTQPRTTSSQDKLPPPRRQSSTLEDYLKFKQCLSDNNSVATPSRASTESYSSGASGSAATAYVLTNQQMLEKVQLARRHLDELLVSLKENIKNSEIGEAAAPVPAVARRVTRTKPKMASAGTPTQKTVKYTPPSTTKAAILQTLRRETVAMPSTQRGSPRPLQFRRIKSPAKLPGVTASPKSQYAPQIPVPRPGKGTVALPTNTRPKPAPRRLSAGPSLSGRSSLPLLPRSRSLQSGNSDSSLPCGIPQRRHSDWFPLRGCRGARSLMPPHPKNSSND